MDKEKLFKIYYEIYATNFGFMPCIEKCAGQCEQKPLSVLLPYEDEFIFKRSGKRISNEKLKLPAHTVQSPDLPVLRETTNIPSPEGGCPELFDLRRPEEWLCKGALR